MNLKDQKEKILKEYSYSTSYKKYFEIGTNPKYFPIKRIGIVLCTFLLFFLISNIFTLPKLENESLYIFAAQVTIIALVFPIILTLIGILYSKNNDFDSIFKIYIANTNAKTLYRGSFIILLFYVISFFYLYDSLLSEQIRRALNATLGIMFIDAIIITLFFLEKTISFTTTTGVNKILIKYFINSNKNDESINIISIITNRINENIKNSDLNSFEKNVDFLIEFLDIIIIMSTEIKDEKISSNLNSQFEENIFGTKFSKIIFLIQKNIELAISHPNLEFYQSLHSIYFYIFCRNYQILENESILVLLQAHHRHTYFITKEITEVKPKIINEFISSWYKWLNSHLKLDDNLTFNIYKNHLNLTALIINTFSKDKNLRALDYICDCLSRWEDVADKMPNYVEYEDKLQTIFESENLYTFANLALETKILSFYLITKNLDNKEICYKYYEILIKGKQLIRTTDLIINSYSFQTIDEILFSYFRLLSNNMYEYYFNNFLEDIDRVIEISGLMYGGWIPHLENRITNHIIKLLLLNSKKTRPVSTYIWEYALEKSSIARIDKIHNLLLKIQKDIIHFNDYDSLEWHIKKLEITKKRLSDYIENLIKFISEHQKLMFNSIKLDSNKTQKIVSESTFYVKNLDKFKDESIFSPLISNKKISYKNNIKTINSLESLPSKYLTTDYNIHIDNILKPDYYYHLIDSFIFKSLDQKKITEIYFEKDSSLLLKKILLRSYIYASPIVFLGNSKIFNFILHNINRTLLHSYKIECSENNRFYKIGETIFKYSHTLPDDRVYITPSNIIEHINFEKVTPETLSSVHVSLSNLHSTQVDIYVTLPIEITLVKNSQVIEIFIKE